MRGKRESKSDDFGKCLKKVIHLIGLCLTLCSYSSYNEGYFDGKDGVSFGVISSYWCTITLVCLSYL